MEKINILERAFRTTEEVSKKGCFYCDGDEFNYFADLVFLQLNEIKKQKDLQLFNYVYGPKFYTMEIGCACAKRVIAHDKLQDSELTFRYVSMVTKHFGIGNGIEFFDVTQNFKEVIDRYFMLNE